MKTSPRVIALGGFLLNIVLGTFACLYAIRHPRWEDLTFTPEARITYYERMLHILCDQAMPWFAGGMFFSAVLFLMLRKKV
jgi:hypothetical protein